MGVPPKPNRKLNRLRAVGNQIRYIKKKTRQKYEKLYSIIYDCRFLRRLERSTKARSAASTSNRSPSIDSFCHDDGDDDDDDEDMEDDTERGELYEHGEPLESSDGGQDSPGVTSPLLIRSPAKTAISTALLFNNKPTSTASSTSATSSSSTISRQKRLENFYGTNVPWRSREHRSINGAEANSD